MSVTKLISYMLLFTLFSDQTGFAQQVKKKPNVLFIICDDLNTWSIHAPGAPKALTPNIDRLRRRSVTFTNAHAVVPVCGPSRVSFMTGLYPQTTGFYGAPPWEWNTIASVQNCVPIPLDFRNNGYEVYGTGKLFHEGAGGDFYTAYGIQTDYGPWPWKGKGKPENTANPAHYAQWIPYLPEMAHRDLEYGPLSDVPNWKPDSAKGIPGAYGWYNTDGTPLRYVNDNDRDRLPDEVSADWAVDILKKKHDRPFFLGVGFVRPHSPLHVPKKYFDMFPLKDIKLPPYLKDDLKDCAPALIKRWPLGFMKFNALIKGGGEKAWKEWVQAYLACIAFTDDQAGKVLNALDAGGYADNTIVVFTGDNGYHVGEKDMIQKWCLWNPSTNVPLIVHVPGKLAQNGQASEYPVSLIDIYPTLVDFAGLPQQPNTGKSGLPLEGFSLRQLLKNPDQKTWVRPAALMAVLENKFPHDFSICTPHYRYTLCGNGEEEMYDHDKDPNEWTNLAGNPKFAAIHKQLRNELMKMLGAKAPPWFGIKNQAL